MRQKRSGVVQATRGSGLKAVPPVAGSARQYVFCPDRKGNPHIAIEVCRSDKCGKYATCKAGGLDEEKATATPAPKKPKPRPTPKPSALERVLAEDTP